MKTKDGRGLHRKDVGAKNREIIIKFFKENPDSTRTECAVTTGLSHVTIRKHLNDIENGE